MSDAGDDTAAVADVEMTEEKSAAPAAPAVVSDRMTLQDALIQVLKVAVCNDGCARGLHEAAKALDK